MENAVLLAKLINNAFVAMSIVRQFNMSNEEINRRFAQVDAGFDAITPAEVQAKITALNNAIAEGRALHETNS